MQPRRLDGLPGFEKPHRTTCKDSEYRFVIIQDLACVHDVRMLACQVPKSICTEKNNGRKKKGRELFTISRVEGYGVRQMSHDV